MPWDRKQAIAILLSYKRRGKEPPAKVKHDLSTSLKGTHPPKSKRAKKRHHRKKVSPPGY